MKLIEDKVKNAEQNQYSARFILSLFTWGVIILAGLPLLFSTDIQTAKQAGILLTLCLIGSLLLMNEKFKKDHKSFFYRIKDEINGIRTVKQAFNKLYKAIKSSIEKFETEIKKDERYILRGFSLILLTSVGITLTFWFYDANMNYQDLGVGFVAALFYVYLFTVGIWVIAKIMVTKHQNKKDELDDLAQQTTKNLVRLNPQKFELSAENIFVFYWYYKDELELTVHSSFNELENWILNDHGLSKDEVKEKFGFKLDLDTFPRLASKRKHEMLKQKKEHEKLTQKKT